MQQKYLALGKGLTRLWLPTAVQPGWFLSSVTSKGGGEMWKVHLGGGKAMGWAF